MNFELNFAASSILGMVGAGGIGYVISQSFRAYKYDRAMVAIILVFLVSYLLELSFTSLKRKLKV
jgi:phosphonate transport system permease protein